MNALNTPLAEPDPEVHAALAVIALARRPEPDIAALSARTKALAAKHPLPPHLTGEGDAR